MNENIKAVWQAISIAQRVQLSIVTGSLVYMGVILIPHIVGDEDWRLQCVSGFVLVMYLQMSLRLLIQLYKAILNQVFERYYHESEDRGYESRFIDALSPRMFESLYDETIPRNGFSGLIQARTSACRLDAPL